LYPQRRIVTTNAGCLTDTGSSQERIEVTNQLYFEVQVSLPSALDLFDMYNKGLTDRGLHLGNDRNPTSVMAIEQKLLLLTQAAEALETRLALCWDARQVYEFEN
jgi:hypothetical protein